MGPLRPATAFERGRRIWDNRPVWRPDRVVPVIRTEAGLARVPWRSDHSTPHRNSGIPSRGSGCPCVRRRSDHRVCTSRHTLRTDHGVPRRIHCHRPMEAQGTHMPQRSTPLPPQSGHCRVPAPLQPTGTIPWPQTITPQPRQVPQKPCPKRFLPLPLQRSHFLRPVPLQSWQIATPLPRHLKHLW
jgi:hypothetical protein